MKNKKSARKNFSNSDYKKFAKILKEAHVLDVDLRAKLTPYKKRKIRELVKENDGAVIRMAQYRHESKARKYLGNKLDFDSSQKIDAANLTKKMKSFTEEYRKGNISKAQYRRTLNYYREMRSHVTGKNINNSFGLKNFTAKKVSAHEAEILKAHGWTVIKGKAYLPTDVNHSKSYLGVRYYTFPDGTTFPALVESIKNSPTKHKFKYFLLGDSGILTALFQRLEEEGIDNLYPDLLYSSPTRSKDSLNRRSFFPSITLLLNYVTNSILDKDENKNKSADVRQAIFDMFVESIHILSHQTPSK